MAPSRFASIVRQWSARLQGVEFREGDFEQTTADARAGDFLSEGANLKTNSLGGTLRKCRWP